MGCHNRRMGLGISIPTTLACALLLAGAIPAQAEECDATWFPDFQCERSGRFEGFHKPFVQPYLFEDPFITTGLYGIYIYHDFPNGSALGGGHANAVALQARVALTDRLALIATKDGRVWMDPGLPLLDDREGWMNIAAGLKYALIQNREKRYIVSGVLRFEADTGSTDLFQGQGDGIIIPSITGAWGTDRFHIMGDVGAQIPLDSDDNSEQIFWHLYADYNIVPRFSLFGQVSGIHWVGSGKGTMPIELNVGVTLPIDTVQTVLGTGPFEGADIMNFGSRRASGLDLITVAAGAHVVLTDHITLSAAYERSVTHYEGIFDSRVTTSLIFEF